MAESPPECEIGKMTESGTEEMDWEEMEEMRDAEEKKREEEEKKSVKNSNYFMDHDESTSEDKVSATVQDDQMKKFSTEKERQHERKHVVGLTVSDGAKRRKTVSAGQAMTSGDEDASANEIDLKDTSSFVETSTKKEKSAKISEKILGKQKPTTQLKLSQTKLNFKKMEEFNDKIDKKEELQSEKVVIKDKEGNLEVSEETTDEEIEGHEVDTLLQILQNGWERNEIKPQTIKVSKKCLMEEVVKLRDSLKKNSLKKKRDQEIKGKEIDKDERSETSSESRSNSSDEMMKEDELNEIEGETNKWLDDLDEWELKIVAKFKEVNMIEGKTSLENHIIERKMNILLRSVQFEANNVKKNYTREEKIMSSIQPICNHT